MKCSMQCLILLSFLLPANVTLGQDVKSLFREIRLGMFVGGKSYGDRDIGNTKGSVGAEFGAKPKRSPIALAAGVHYADACPQAEVFGSDVIGGRSTPRPPDAVWFDARCLGPWYNNQPSQYTMEFDLGFRWRLERWRWQPFVGGGIAFLYTALDRDFRTGPADLVSSWGRGPWLSAGIVLQATKQASVGLEVRHSRATATVYGREAELGGLHVGLLFEFYLKHGGAVGGRTQDRSGRSHFH